jgi:hypothetical protein
MKNYYQKSFAIAFVLLSYFLNIHSLSAQPWPDKNFCVISAKLIYQDSVCLVVGHNPLVFNWDDGSAENYFSWTIPNGMVSVKYHPPGYPLRILGGSIYVGDGSFPEGADFIGSNMRILIFDDDGPNNLPGTVLDSTTIIINNFEWVAFDGLNTIIEEGDFFIGMEQLNSPPYAAPVGVDEQSPFFNKSYVKQAEGEWQLSAYQDFMIRAYTCDTQYVSKQLTPENFTWYELAIVSGFDPDKGEGPEDGLKTTIDSLTYFYYKDTLFYANSPGYYAYAVRIIQENSDTTGWYYTNTINHKVTHTEENNPLLVFRTYPNPVFDEVRISASELIRFVEVFNTSGRKVFSQKYNDKEISIQTRSFRKGLYYIRVKTDQAITSKKILKL